MSEELDKIKAQLDELQENSPQNVSATDISQQTIESGDVVVSSKGESKFDIQASNSQFVQSMSDNATAVEMAKEAYKGLKNQKNIAKGIKKIAIDNTNADLETAQTIVEEKKKNNKIKKQEIKNELLKLRNDKIFMQKEQRHKLNMQKFKQRKEKYGDLLLRHCRKKQKNADGKWEYLTDENGNSIINMPNGFTLFWLIFFDSIVMFLNQTADIFSGLNKVVFKIFWIVLIGLILLVPSIRHWIFAAIGINFG